MKTNYLLAIMALGLFAGACRKERTCSCTTKETVVTNPAIPGLELHIPAGTVIRDSQGNIVNQVSITAIPVDQPPFPLPLGVPVPVYFTIQPGGAHLQYIVSALYCSCDCIILSTTFVRTKIDFNFLRRRLHGYHCG